MNFEVPIVVFDVITFGTNILYTSITWYKKTRLWNEILVTQRVIQINWLINTKLQSKQVGFFLLPKENGPIRFYMGKRNSKKYNKTGSLYASICARYHQKFSNLVQYTPLKCFQDKKSISAVSFQDFIMLKHNHISLNFSLFQRNL